jgi:phenylalanyl-tRNA synthetase beta chain
VAVLNPIASDQRLLRTSLIPGIWKNIVDNSRHFDSFRLFEIGYEIHKRAGQLPDEIDHLAAAVYERDGDGRAGLFELKRVAECLMPTCEVRPAAPRPYEHPARSWEVLWRGLRPGRLFELHPSLCAGRAAILDVDLEMMRRLGPEPKRYQPLRRFPSSAFDLSVVAGLRELAGDIERRLVELAGQDLESIRFLRRYTGPPLEEGKQSLTWRLSVCAADHTLTAEEVSAIRARIIEGLQASGFELRL